jgi:hypothetical protein
MICLNHHHQARRRHRKVGGLFSFQRPHINQDFQLEPTQAMEPIPKQRQIIPLAQLIRHEREVLA